MPQDNPYEPTPAVRTAEAPPTESSDRNVLARMFVLWRRCLAPLAVLGVVDQVGSVPVLLASGGKSIVDEPLTLFTELATGNTWSTAVAGAAAVLVSLPLSVLAAVASFLVIRAVLRGQRLGPLEALSAALPSFWRYLRAHIVLSVILLVLKTPMDLYDHHDLIENAAGDLTAFRLFGPLLITLVSGVGMAFLMCVWAAVYPVVVFEGRGALDSLRRSARLTRGHRWTILGVGIVLMLMFVGAAVPGTIVNYEIDDEVMSSAVSRLAYAVVTMPLTIAFFYAIYEGLLRFDPDRESGLGNATAG